MFRLSRMSAEPEALLSAQEDSVFSLYRVETGQVDRTMRGPGGETTVPWVSGLGGATMMMGVLQWELRATGDSPATVLELAIFPPAASDE